MIVHICDLCDGNRTDDVCKLCRKDACFECSDRCSVCEFVFCNVCLEGKEDFFKNCEKCGKKTCVDDYNDDGFCSKCSFTVLPPLNELDDLSDINK